jgi:hypothetical protein
MESARAPIVRVPPTAAFFASKKVRDALVDSVRGVDRSPQLAILQHKQKDDRINTVFIHGVPLI